MRDGLTEIVWEKNNQIVLRTKYHQCSRLCDDVTPIGITGRHFKEDRKREFFLENFFRWNLTVDVLLPGTTSKSVTGSCLPHLWILLVALEAARAMVEMTRPF